MAIAFDSSAADADGSGNNSTFNGNPITISAAGQPLLICGLIAGATLTSPAITYNSVSMTLIAGPVAVGVGAGEKLYLFALVNPATGSAISPVVTYSLINTFKVLLSASYTGVSQTGVPTNVATAQSSTSQTSFTSSLTVDSTANSWVVMYARNDSGTFTAGTGTTIRQQTPGNANMIADSGGTVTASASYSMTASWTGAVPWANIMAQLNPATAAGATPLYIPQLLTTKVG